MRLYQSLYVCGVMLLGLGCGSGSKTVEVVEPDEPKQYKISVETAKDTLYRDQKVVIEGYLDLPFSMYYMERAPLLLYERPLQRAGRYLDVKLNTTDSINGIVKLPSGYTRADLRILTEEGDTLRATERVRLSGYLRWEDVDGEGKLKKQVLMVDTVRVGREKPAQYTSLKFVVLDSGMVGDSTRRHYLVQAEGMLGVPSLLFARDEYWLWLEGTHGKVSASFPLGAVPNGMESVPESYTEKDVKVYDHAGKLIDLKRPIRVIGNYSGPDDLTDGEISVEHLEQVGGE